MRAGALPCVGVYVENERIRRHPDKRIGDHVRMLGEKERGQDRAGASALYVGGAHPVEERRAIVAGHADEDSPVEGKDARIRTIGCLEMWHDRIKILQLGGAAYRSVAGGETPRWRLPSTELEGW